METNKSLIKKRYKALSEIEHPWNDLMILNPDDFVLIPQFREKYKNKPFDFKYCDYDKLFEEIHKRLISVEPLFEHISLGFKKELKFAVNYASMKKNNDEEGYSSQITWVEIYHAFIKIGLKFNPKAIENLTDKVLLKKIDINDYMMEELNKRAGSDNLNKIVESFKAENSNVQVKPYYSKKSS